MREGQRCRFSVIYYQWIMICLNHYPECLEIILKIGDKIDLRKLTMDGLFQAKRVEVFFILFY